MVRDLTEEAREAVLPFGKQSELLIDISEFVETRCN
jgi:hypothetical protein